MCTDFAWWCDFFIPLFNFFKKIVFLFFLVCLFPWFLAVVSLQEVCKTCSPKKTWVSCYRSVTLLFCLSLVCLSHAPSLSQYKIRVVKELPLFISFCFCCCCFPIVYHFWFSLLSLFGLMKQGVLSAFPLFLSVVIRWSRDAWVGLVCFAVWCFLVSSDWLLCSPQPTRLSDCCPASQPAAPFYWQRHQTGVTWPSF